MLFYEYFVSFYVFACCSMYCFVSFFVLFVCLCVLNYCHWVVSQLQLNISYQCLREKSNDTPGLLRQYILASQGAPHDIITWDEVA